MSSVLRNFDNIGNLEFNLSDIRKADAKHDLEDICNKSPNEVFETLPIKNNNTFYNENYILNKFINDVNDVENRYIRISNKLYTHDIDYKDNDEKDKNKIMNDSKAFNSRFCSNKTEREPKVDDPMSLIEELFRDNNIEGDIFFHVDVAYKKFKKDLSYVKERNFYWVNSKTQNYDPAGKVHPGTDIGRLICGFNYEKNTNLRFCWEDISPGIKRNILYPKWNSGSYSILESSIFTPYNIFMINSGTDINNYKTQETQVIITDEKKPNKYIYSNKDLSNKNGSNINLYQKLAKNFNSIFKSLFDKNDNSDLNDIINKSEPSNFDNKALIVSKFLGDSSQYLFTGIKNMQYRYKDNISQEIKTVISNNNNCFVSLDRIAVAAAIYLNVPIVLYDKPGGTFDLFISKDLVNVNALTNLYKDKFINENEKNLFNKIKINIENYETKYKDYETKYKIYAENIVDIEEKFLKFKEITTFEDKLYKQFLYFIHNLIIPFNFSSGITVYNIDILINKYKVFYDKYNDKKINDYLVILPIITDIFNIDKLIIIDNFEKNKLITNDILNKEENQIPFFKDFLRDF